jgi:hypothetical protein
LLASLLPVLAWVRSSRVFRVLEHPVRHPAELLEHQTLRHPAELAEHPVRHPAELFYCRKLFYHVFVLKGSFKCSAAFKRAFQPTELDSTLESSKIVKLALTWVATTQSDAIK